MEGAGLGKDPQIFFLVFLVPKLQLGNRCLEALASRVPWKQELPKRHYQARAWERGVNNCQTRNTSATDQAWANAPRGVMGASPSKISLRLPTQ